MSDKSKRKAKPERKSAKLIGSIAVLILLISAVFIMNWQSHRNSEPPINEFAATVTQFMIDVTQTAVFLEEEGCKKVEITQWQVDIFFDSDAEIDMQQSGASNDDAGLNWLCDDRYVYENREYYVSVFIETDDTNFVLPIDQVVEFLKNYPPSNVTSSPPIILLAIHQPSITAFTPGFSMNYEELMEAFDSGLSGAELIEAVATPIE